MGGSDDGKQVFFIGAWRAQQFSDQLLRQISSQISSKKGFLTDLKITTEGLELRMQNANGKITRHDKIALENIVDFIDNKYSTTCTLAIVRDKQQKIYTVFVFICKSDKDAAALIQLFKETKGQLSGEGYNFDLTPKGHNWLLQEKSEATVQRSVNGEVRVFANSIPNGNEYIDGTNMSTDTHSRASVRSSSNSEVREEISHLAEEVRDIKRLLEGSRGRSKFEDHYGYRILPGKKSPMIPVTSPTQFVEREVKVQQPASVSRSGHVVYARNGTYHRYPEGSQRIMVTKGSVPRGTRRRRVVAVSPTRQAYTKRVYESKNPYVETTEVRRYPQPVQQVRYVTQPQPQFLMPRSRSRGSSSAGSYRSDVVHKSIENVYRQRPSRRVYLPPQPPTSPTFPAEAIYTHEVRDTKHLHPKDAQLQRQVNGGTVHVKLDPEVRTFYENDGVDIDVKAENGSHVSTTVNTSVNDDLDDKMRQIESSYNLANSETIIIRAENEISRSAPEGEANVHVVRTESNNSVNKERRSSTEGNVYHVKAEYASDPRNDRNTEMTYRNDDIIVVQSNSESFRAENQTIESPTEHIVQTGIKDTYEVEDDIAVNGEEEQDLGLFESYVKKPEEYDNEAREIVEEKAVRYHEDEGEIQDTVIEYGKSVEVEAEDETEDDVETNDGLFGAYTKPPDDDIDERRSSIVAETAFRYHEDTEEKTENEDNESNDTEKRVRYNDNVEQIPITGIVVPADIEERNMQATYEADQPNETTEFAWGGSKISDRIQRLNARARGESVASDKEDEDEDDYQLDMEALRAYSNDPDIVIVESNEESRVRSVAMDVDRVSLRDDDVKDVTDSIETEIEHRRPSVEIPNEVEDLQMSDRVKLPVTDDDLKEYAAKKVPRSSIPDEVMENEVEDLQMSDRVKLPVTDDDLKEYAAKKVPRSSIPDEVMEEIRNRTEDTVLF